MRSKKIFYEEYTTLCKVTRLLETDKHIQHGNTSVFLHCVATAYFSYSFALFLRIPFRERDLIRGALLHDYFLYDWHVKDGRKPLHGFHHSKKALENAINDIELSETEKDIISKHMFPLTPKPPKFRESLIVCFIDKLCSVYEIIIIKPYPKLQNKILKKHTKVV